MMPDTNPKNVLMTTLELVSGRGAVAAPSGLLNLFLLVSAIGMVRSSAYAPKSFCKRSEETRLDS